MCDSLVANREVTLNKRTLFAKISDRCTNEPQYFVYVPASDHSPDEKIHTVYVDNVEQASHTNAVILSKPSWIWGAEMGVNEYGVCCGNETIYTKEYGKEPALMGLDILRMALERAKTAREALDVATGLLEKYGQGGSCAFDEIFYYDNSFLFVDRKESWIMETSGSRYAVRQAHGARSISNCMNISACDIMSPDLIEHAVKMHYPVSEPFDFTESFIDWSQKGNISGTIRRACTQRKLDSCGNRVRVQDMIAAMQSHTTDDPFHHGNYSPCMHVTGPDGPHQSCNSMAVELGDKIVIWGAGNSNPCCSLYKPFWFDAFSSDVVFGYDRQNEAISKWVKIERIHRAIASGRICEAEYKKQLQILQQTVFDEYEKVKDTDRETRQAFCDRIAASEERFLQRWETIALNSEDNWQGTEEYRELWEKYNSTLGLDRRIL